MKNYQLYSRILRLVTTYPAECRLRAAQSGQDPDGLEKVVKDVIFPDATLVWC